MTEQRLLCSIVKRRRLSLFGYIARMDGEADANRILFEPLPDLWRRPPGRPRSTWLKNINGDLTLFDMELLEARDAAQNRLFQFRRILALYSAMHQ